MTQQETLAQLQQDLEMFELDLKAAEHRLDILQARYVSNPNAALLVKVTEARYLREQLMYEIKRIFKLIVELMEERDIV